MRERDIENYLVKRVKELGGECRKVKWIGRAHAPDRVVMLPARDGEWSKIFAREPRLAWVELKAPGEKPRPGQLREHERMRKLGQRVEVVDSIEDVEWLLA